MRYLHLKHFVIFITIGLVLSCRDLPSHLNRVSASNIPVDSTLVETDSIAQFIAPYKDRLNHVLDSTLAYAPKVISKTDGARNTSAGNLLADIVLQEADPVYFGRTGDHIDFALLNHGGIRSVISQGPVSARTAYEVMPFENSIVIARMQGKAVRELLYFLIESDRQHPFSGLQITVDKNNELLEVNIQGVPFDEERIYHIATSSYLITGGDRMVFFKDALEFIKTDYKIRNAMIDYFGKVDTLNARVDDRFIQIMN